MSDIKKIKFFAATLTSFVLMLSFFSLVQAQTFDPALIGTDKAKCKQDLPSISWQCDAVFQKILADYDASVKSPNLYVDCSSYSSQICSFLRGVGRYLVDGNGTGGGGGGGAKGLAGATCSSPADCATGLSCSKATLKCGGGCTLDNDCSSNEFCDLGFGINQGACSAKTSSGQTGGLTGGSSGEPTGVTGGVCARGNCPEGLCQSGNGLCLPEAQFKTGLAATKSLPELLTNIIKILLFFAGTVAVVMLVVGGFWYMTAGGNEEQSEKGKKTILNFVLGLAVIILAYTLVTVIADLLTNNRYTG